jgi:hypothetical protein
VSGKDSERDRRISAISTDVFKRRYGEFAQWFDWLPPLSAAMGRNPGPCSGLRLADRYPMLIEAKNAAWSAWKHTLDRLPSTN